MIQSTFRSIDRKALRQFGLTMGGMIAGLFGLLLPLLLSRRFPAWPWVVAGIFFACALVRPESLGIVYEIWTKLGHILAAINARILLGIIYYLVVVPIGLAMRLWGRDPLARTFAAGQATYRIVREDGNIVERMERPF